MEAKYHMTREETLFVVRRNIVDYIWKSARLEGLTVTYPDTEAIYNGMSVQGVKPCAEADVSGRQQEDIHAGRQPCDDWGRVRHYFRSH